MNQWNHAWGFIFFFLVMLLGQPVFAQDTGTATTHKTKSYAERYKEFYDPKNYSQNYKDLHKGENYRNHYNAIHRENADQFRNATRIKNQNDTFANNLAEDARRLNPEAADMFKVDKYGRKIEPVSGYVGPDAFTNAYAYRDFQYRKRGYDTFRGPLGKNIATGTGLWIPNPAEAIRDGQWQDNPLTQSLYSKTRRTNALPQSETINLPIPMPTPETDPPPLLRGTNPFLPYLQMPVSNSESVQSPTGSDTPPLEDELPFSETIREKPAHIPTSSSPETDLPIATDRTMEENLEGEIQGPPVPPSLAQEDLAQEEIVEPPSQPDPNTLQPPAVQQPAPSQPVPLSPTQILYNQGVQSFAQRNYPRAKQIFENLVETNPASPYIRFGHGLSLFYAGNYSQSRDTFLESDRISTQKRTPSPTLWQMQTRPIDFRFHMKKLAQYVEKNPKDKAARDLLFYLSRISSTPPTAMQ